MEFTLCGASKVAIDLLEGNNHQVYIVGGAVRDLYLNRVPHDYDITTSATLDEIKEVFKDFNIKSYKKGHTLGIVIDHEYVEVSTFDGESIEEDLSNRDFTINAMAYSKGEIIDLFNSRYDLDNKIIRCVKEPKETIKNDPLRILRALRFSQTLGFKIENELSDFIKNNENLLVPISKERITTELKWILESNKPSYVLREYKNVFGFLFPPLKETFNFDQMSRWHHLDVFEHILCVIDNTLPIEAVRLAALFHDIEKPACFTIDNFGNGHFYNHYEISAQTCEWYMSEYQYSKDLNKLVTNLVRHHDFELKNTKESCLRFLHDYGDKYLDYYFSLKRADIVAQNPELIYRLREIDEIEKMVYSLVETSAPYCLKNLSVKGTDLKKLGVAESKINDVLEHTLMFVIKGKIINDKNTIKDYLVNHKEWYR